MKQPTTKMLRQRKFLLVLPLLVIPFLTMAFWALGGGTDTAPATLKTDNRLNLDLPVAALNDDRAMDKMSYYDKAQSDSEKLIEQMKNDPYFVKAPAAADSILSAFTDNYPRPETNKLTGNNNSDGYTGTNYKDPNETKVYQKLAQLNAVLKGSSNGNTKVPEYATLNNQAGVEATDLDRLDQMMQGMNGNKTEDPEMKQLSSMLEKILDIQHPERVKQHLKDSFPQRKETNYNVNALTYPATFSLIDSGESKGSSVSYENFFGADPEQQRNAPDAIEAVVHGSQTLVTGGVIKLRLCSPVTIKSITIAKDNFVFGTVTLNNERLEINIASIRYGNTILPVKMEVYDMDGMAGIYIPGAIGRDVAKQSGDNALQSVSLGTLDPSLGAQAASAGIETAKNLLSKKVKLIKVQVKAGYKILLKDSQQ